jgi:hypothetical protein
MSTSTPATMLPLTIDRPSHAPPHLGLAHCHNHEKEEPRFQSAARRPTETFEQCLKAAPVNLPSPDVILTHLPDDPPIPIDDGHPWATKPSCISNFTITGPRLQVAAEVRRQMYSKDQDQNYEYMLPYMVGYKELPNNQVHAVMRLNHNRGD